MSHGWSNRGIEPCRRFTDLGRTTYAYRFDRVSPGNRRTGMLAFHCSEIPYVFGHLVPAADAVLALPRTEIDPGVHLTGRRHRTGELE